MITQKNIILEFFKNNPDREIQHPEVVDWCTEAYKKRTGKVFRDPDRQIRKLAQTGFLIKIKKGVYKYDPNYLLSRKLEEFSPQQKRKILERDGYKCVICGKGKKDGIELHVDHIKPKDLGGKATIENGQTLCAQHNFFKKTFKQTETGKKMFIRLYELSKSEGNQVMLDFCSKILEIFEKYDVNGHIIWNK